MELEEALKKIEELESTNSDLVTSDKKLETANSSLVDERTTLKQKIKDGSTDDTLKAELEKAQSLLAEKDAEVEAVRTETTQELAKRDMISQLHSLGVKAHNDKALNEIANTILGEAVYEDGAFKFVDEDGTTKYNEAKKPFSIQDKINDMKSGDDSFRFAPSTGGGASDTTTAPTPSNDINSILDANLKY